MLLQRQRDVKFCKSLELGTYRQKSSRVANDGAYTTTLFFKSRALYIRILSIPSSLTTPVKQGHTIGNYRSKVKLTPKRSGYVSSAIVKFLIKERFTRNGRVLNLSFGVYTEEMIQYGDWATSRKVCLTENVGK